MASTKGEPPAARPCVWGVGTSRTIRVHWALLELGIEYTWREIIPRTPSMEDPAFLAVSRRGKVPMLELDGTTIGESGAIALHLADTYRDHAVLSPEPGARDRGVFYDRCIFALMELDAPLYIVRRHEGLAEVYGESPVAAASARDYYQRQAGIAAAWLAETGFAFGDEFSVADILLASCTAWAQVVGVELRDEVAAHLDRMRERDAFGLAMQRNFPPAALRMLAAQGGPPTSTETQTETEG